MQSGELSLQQQVGSAISGCPYFSARRVRFEAVDDHVVLEGIVNSYFQKQMAQEAVLRIDGVRQIDNRLQVLAGAARSSVSGAATSARLIGAVAAQDRRGAVPIER